MKNLINFIIFFAALVYIIDVAKKRDIINKNTDEFPPELYGNTSEKDDVPTQNTTEPISNIDKDENLSIPETDDSQIIYISALGNVDESDLEFASSVIQDFYGFEVTILPQTDIDPYILNSDGTIHSVKACSKLDRDVRTVYITEELLYDNRGVLLRGTTSGDNNTIIVRGETRFLRETLIHEIGHSFGLDHCEDLTCVMAVANDAYDSGDFCNKCKNNIVY